MADASIIQGDQTYMGVCRHVGALVVPPSSFGDTEIKAGAEIVAAKMQHRHEFAHREDAATSATTRSIVLGMVKKSTATLKAFRAGCAVVNIGAATITIDLKKQPANTTLLTAVITLSSSQANFDIVAATLSATALVANDVLQAIITATAGGGTLGKGLFLEAEVEEASV